VRSSALLEGSARVLLRNGVVNSQEKDGVNWCPL
jgi:hypothetical protein